MILVVAEHRDGKVNRAVWETIAAAQSLGRPVSVAVLGDNVAAPAAELASADAASVVTIEHPALAQYTPDGFVNALAQAIAALAPELVLLPHTYQTRDFAPALAARLGRAMVTDCIGFKRKGDALVCSRPMFQGKLTADIIPQ